VALVPSAKGMVAVEEHLTIARQALFLQPGFQLPRQVAGDSDRVKHGYDVAEIEAMMFHQIGFADFGGGAAKVSTPLCLVEIRLDALEDSCKRRVWL
jgi:hypothetical protein